MRMKQRSKKNAVRGHAKRLANQLAVFLRKPPFYELTLIERVASSGILGFPNKQINAARKWMYWGFQETLIGWSLMIFFGLLLIVQIFGKDVGAVNLWTEFWGLIFDVLIILVGFGVIQNWKQKREDIARQHELIEDFKRWDNEEARHRIVGAIRRLSRRGITKIDLTGCILRNVNFYKNGISSLSGSRLSGTHWADVTYNTSIFENVDFSQLDCREVQFEKAATMNGFTIGSSAQFQNCRFWDADLRGAKFDGAELIWSEKPPETMDEIIDEEPDGRSIYTRVVIDRFNDTDLADTSFKYCKFKWADFREAYNIESAIFYGAKGLETCVFDNEELKASVIQRSKEKPAS